MMNPRQNFTRDEIVHWDGTVVRLLDLEPYSEEMFEGFRTGALLLLVFENGVPAQLVYRIDDARGRAPIAAVWLREPTQQEREAIMPALIINGGVQLRGYVTEADLRWRDFEAANPSIDSATLAAFKSGASMVRSTPLDSSIENTFERLHAGIGDKDRLTPDEEAALCYKAGARISVSSEGKLTIDPPCGIKRVGDRWHVMIGKPPPVAILNPPSSP